MSKFTKVLISVGVVGLLVGIGISKFYIIPPAPSAVALEVDNPTPRQKNSKLPSSEPIVEDILPELSGPPIPEPPQSVSSVALPSLSGRDLWDAQNMLAGMELIVIVKKDTSSFELPNTVLRQSPSAGQRMFKGDTVYITVSEFP